MQTIKFTIVSIFCIVFSAQLFAVEVFSCDSADCKSQFKQYKKFAKNGSPDAQEILAYLYLNGYGVEADPGKASRWFKKAANQGQTGAKASLAYMYIRGQGKKQDVERGINMLAELANDKVHQAALQLGLLFAQGQYIQQDYKLAEQWLMQAIAGGNQKAIYLLGLIYEYGLSGQVKLEDAKMLYQHIAANNQEAAARLQYLANVDSTKALADAKMVDIFNLSNDDPDIERIEVVNNIDTFLTDNLAFIESQGIYTSSSTGSRIKGKRCNDNVNCKAAINAQDKFNIINFWQGLNTIKPHVRTGGLQ
ncbi:hypothetical protein tinsulaeT_21190 [Thalassotalea insulae]|uniref:Sel1 repeat family protein n=1 Tax=Thalassotalea insulae TaxID=2056778 RepID=A0ABQ6GT15_9GAMM|nr:tetratricopeptide repeat protein [Thalassotalea insulae]GLX78779.1 hypothetical protein tinsulaeT_21190 [Thalassotalea insulae]